MNVLEGKAVAITGGASGIGLATAEAFLDKGAKVILSDFNVEAGEEAVENLKDKGEVHFVKADATKEEDIKNLVSETVEQFGSLDVIFNNAGVGAQGQTHELDYEDYKNVIKLNQDGVFLGMKYALQQMRKQGSGVIINNASILGLVGEPTAFAYNASKGAVVLMTKSVALQYADENIRCAAVAPGYVESSMVNREELGEYYDGLVEKHPIGRLGKPEEIAHAVIFLAENEFVTGITLPVEGGYTAQ